MSLLNKMPEVGTPEYFAMLEAIPAQVDARTAANKARFAPIVKAAGLNPDTYDYANIQPEIFDKLGSQNARALQLSTMDYGNQERVQDFDAYTGAANRAIGGGLSDDAMWADYEKNKYKQSDFQNFMQSGIKAGLGAMMAAGAGDIAGLWNLGGGETAAMGLNQVGAMNPALTNSAITLGEPIALGSSAGVTPSLIGGSGVTLGAPVALGSSAGVTPTMIGSGAAATGGGLLETIGNAVKPVTTAIKGVNDLTGGNLGGIIGGLAGAAASGDTTTSASKDPWGPAQQYLKDNLAQNKRMQDYYSANPFSQEQKQAYQGLLNTNANGMSNAGNFNQIAQNFMGSNRGLMGQMPTLNQGVTAPQVDWTKYANIGKGG